MLRQREGRWKGGVIPHTEYQQRPVEWITQKLRIPEHTIRWSMNSEYKKCSCETSVCNTQTRKDRNSTAHIWDGDFDPMITALETLAKGKSLSISSATATGKTFTIAACATLWWLAAYENSIVLSLSPKQEQLLLNMWKELGKLWPTFKAMFPSALLLTGKLRMVGKGDEDEIEGMREVWAATAFGAGVGADEEFAQRLKGFHCLSDDHQILAKRGWLGIDELTVEDFVLSVPLNEKIARWMPVTNVYRYQHRGIIHEYNSRAMSFAATSEHRFPMKYLPREQQWKMRGLHTMAKQFLCRRTVGWAGKQIKVPACFASWKLTPAQFAEFVGFWTGDGGVVFDRSQGCFYRVELYQVKKDDGYFSRLISWFPHYALRDGVATSNRAVAQWLVDNVGRYGYDRKVPDILREASSSIIRAYLKGLWRADGNVRSNGSLGTLYNTSRSLMDHVQEMLMKIGNPASIQINKKKGTVCQTPYGPRKARRDCYLISYCDGSSDHLVKTSRIEKRNYDGRVWCIETPFETFVTRRKGRVFVSGNSPRMLWVIEEMPGVDQAKINTIIKTATAEFNPIVGMGQPTHKFDTLTNFGKRDWVTAIRMSAFDFPNVVCDRDIIPGARTKQSVIRDIQDAGGNENDPEILSQVRGIPPAQSSRALIRQEWCEAAVGRMSDPVYRQGGLSLGVDVADSPTGDLCAISRWQGAACTEVEAFRLKEGEDASTVGRKVYQEMVEHGILAKHVGVDYVGVGASTINELKRLGKKVRAIGTRTIQLLDTEGRWSEVKKEQGREKPVGPSVIEAERYANTRSQIYWRLREDLRLGRIALPNDPVLFEELTAMEYEELNEKITVGDKASLKIKLGRSPDRADSLTYGNWVRPRNVNRSETSQAALVVSTRVDIGLERYLERHEKEAKAQRVMNKKILRQLQRRGSR